MQPSPGGPNSPRPPVASLPGYQAARGWVLAAGIVSCVFAAVALLAGLLMLVMPLVVYGPSLLQTEAVLAPIMGGIGIVGGLIYLVIGLLVLRRVRAAAFIAAALAGLAFLAVPAAFVVFGYYHALRMIGNALPSLVIQGVYLFLMVRAVQATGTMRRLESGG